MHLCDFGTWTNLDYKTGNSRRVREPIGRMPCFNP